MIIKSHIPLAISRLYPAASLAKSAIAALQTDAWSGGSSSPDESAPALDLRNASLYLPPAVLARVLEVCAGHEGIGEAITRVLSDLVRRRLAEQAIEASVREEPESWASALARVEGLRPLQMRVLGKALPALEAGKIVLSEGGTGLGKSRILALAANVAVQNGVQAVIAAPTLVVLSQIIQEWTGLGSAAVRGGILLGRTQFISPDLVRAALVDPDVQEVVHEAHLDAVREWLAAECPPMSEPGLLRAGLRYLREDLERIAPTFPTTDCLADDTDQAVEAVVQQMRAGAVGADVVFTTHASVAASVRVMRFGKDGIVPIAGRVLLVDEAHQLESTFASAMSQGVSAYSAIVRLRKLLESTKKRSHRKAIDELIDHLRTWPMRMDMADRPQYAIVARGHGDADLQQRIVLAVQSLAAKASAVAQLSPFTRNLAESAERMAATIEDITGSGSGYGALVIRYSPVRRWPSVIIGATSLASAFTDLWERAHGALLTSGTLSLIDGLGVPSFAQAIRTLSIPVDRVRVLDPAIPDWLLSTPVILQPEAAVASQYVPVRDAEGEADEEDPQYIAAIAVRLRAIHESAKGGVLVLLTSYRMIWALQSALADLGEDLIAQSDRVGVEALKRSFVAIRRYGRRPIWLATGPAWTGLNLRDELAESGAEDLLLTDLVVVKVPMPRPETLPAIWRAQRLGFDAIRIEGTFLFRQGLGRLVRCEGLTHRRMWVLDGRMVPHEGANPRWTYVYDMMRRELARYAKRERFG